MNSPRGLAGDIGMRVRFLLCVFALLVFSASRLAGQEYSFKMKSIGVEDGLTSRNISGFFQDTGGLMWIGTDAGINRYDGNQIVSYDREQGQLISNAVQSFAEDARGMLWLFGNDPNLGNEAAVQVFDPQKGLAVTLSDYFGQPLPFEPSSVLGLSSFYGKPGLWIVTVNGIYIYEPEKAVLPLLIKQRPMRLGDLQASARGLWISERGSVSLIDPNGQVIQSSSTNPDYDAVLYGLDRFDNAYYRQFLVGHRIKQVSVGVILSANRLFGNSEESFWYNKRFLGLDPYQGHIWYDDEEKNTIIYDESLKEIHRFGPTENGFHAYPRQIYFDRFGNGWTNHNGNVNILSLQKSNFTNYLSDIRTFGNVGYGARGLYVDRHNQLYVSGLAGSFKVDLDEKTSEVFGPNTSFYGPEWADLHDRKRLDIYSINQRELWYTDEGKRLSKLNVATGQWRDYTYSADQQEKEEAYKDLEESLIHWTVHIDKAQRLWLGKQHGVSFLSKSDSTLKIFKDYGDFPELRRAQVVDFHEDDAGIWIGSQTGLYRMNNDYQVVQRYHRQGESGSYIPQNSIAHIHGASDGTLWLATKGGGIVHLNPKSGVFQQYTEKDGLSDNTVYAVYTDQQGDLWVPSNKGIMQIDTSDFRVTTYLKADGLVQEEFNTTSHFQANDGRIFFGHLNGVTAFNPADFTQPEGANANLSVTGFEKQSKKTGLYTNQLQTFSENQQIELRPGEIGFTIRYSLLNYLDAASDRYSYKVEGIDQEWNYIKEPFIRINALPYGEYKLLLRGQASQGLWSREMSVPISVLKPFYLHTWFIISLIVVLSGIIFLFLKLRERQFLARQTFLETEIDRRTQTIRQQAHELKELDELKSKFFANVSHELRTPLSLVVAPIRNLIKNKSIDEQGKKDLIRVKKNSEQIEKLVEEILDLTKLENKKISPKYKAVKPKEFFSRLHNNFESKALTEGIAFTCQLEGDDSGFALDVDMTERIMNNLLSNAFKFTPAGGSISINVHIDAKRLCATVKDSGMGISAQDLPFVFNRFFQTKDSQRAASGGTGIGLALSKELAQAMDGDLKVSSTPGKGSEFQLTLPNVNASELPVSVLTNGKRKEESILTPLNGRKKQHVLIVEDHTDMRTFIVENLQQQFQVQEAGSGVEALKKLEKTNHKPDIIISDMMMPEMDGMELLKAIRAHTAYKHIPVIMLTARTADKDKLEAFSLGVDDYLVKPFSVDELKARIKNQLKVYESRRVANLVSDVAYSHDHQPDEPLEEWLLKVKQLTQENVHKVDFNIASIAEKLELSQRQFQRRLKSATGYTPGVYLKEIRLQMARTYLEQKHYEQVQEVSLAVGFTSVNYFSRLYKGRFGKNPGAYLVE